MFSLMIESNINKTIDLSPYFQNKQDIYISRQNNEDETTIQIDHFSIAYHNHVRFSFDNKKMIVISESEDYITKVNDILLSPGDPKVLCKDDKLQIGSLLYKKTDDTLEPVLPEPGHQVSIKNISFAYRQKFWQLRNFFKQQSCSKVLFTKLSLDFSENRLTGIIGPSGCGKTTLLRLIGMLDQCDSGSIQINRTDISDQHRKTIAYLPQDDILSPYITVRETFHHNAIIRKIDHRKIIIPQIMNHLGLMNLNHQYISKLSGGERKRVSIGIELLNQPKLFLLDEPTSGLDPDNTINIFKILKGLAVIGVTVIIITHHRGELPYLDDLLVLNQQGRVDYFGLANKYEGI